MRNWVFVLGYEFLLCPDRSVRILIKSRPATSLGNRRGRRVFWEPKCLNYVQHIFPKGRQTFSVGFAPLVTGLIKTNKLSFSEMLQKEHICDRLRKSCTTVE